MVKRLENGKARVSMRIPGDICDEVEAICKAEGVSKTTVCILALRDYILRYKRGKGAQNPPMMDERSLVDA